MKTIERKIKLINEYVDHMPQKAEALEPLFTNLEQFIFMIWQHNDQKQNNFSGYIGSDLWKRNVSLIDSLKLKVINSTLEIL